MRKKGSRPRVELHDVTGNNHENAWLDMVDSKDWKTPTWWGREVIEGTDGIRQTAIRAKVFEDE